MPVQTIKATITYDAICGYCGCKLSDKHTPILTGVPHTQRRLNESAKDAGWFYSEKTHKNICGDSVCVDAWRKEMRLE